MTFGAGFAVCCCAVATAFAPPQSRWSAAAISRTTFVARVESQKAVVESIDVAPIARVSETLLPLWLRQEDAVRLAGDRCGPPAGV